jgi:hypothetical protein
MARYFRIKSLSNHAISRNAGSNISTIRRQVCSYFKDPLVCIGPVATDQIKSVIQYTSGEKRITGQGSRLFKRMPFA